MEDPVNWRWTERAKRVIMVVRVTFAHLTTILILLPNDGTVHGAWCLPTLWTRPADTLLRGWRTIEGAMRAVRVTLAHLTAILIYEPYEDTVLWAGCSSIRACVAISWILRG